MSLKVLAEAGISIEGLRSKSWEEFAGPDAPKMDFVFTVCDNAAGETCPLWPGQPMTAHWGIEDPAAVDGPEFKQRAAFEDAMRFMRNRIAAFTSLPLETIDNMALGSENCAASAPWTAPPTPSARCSLLTRVSSTNESLRHVDATRWR